MKITLNINGINNKWEINPEDSLLKILRQNGYFGVKFGGCQKGECGACTVILDNRPVNSCLVLGVQAEGHLIQTIESIGEHPDQGWKKTSGLHPIQQAFLELGGIQCGYCTPAMVLAAKTLIDRIPDPTELQVREALSGVLCRCTGYLKPVQAVLRAAAVMRGDDEASKPAVPQVWPVPQTKTWARVGKPEVKVDAIKLVQGKPAFTADFERPGILVAKVLHSPIAHGRIRHIDTSKAKALAGVAAVLTWKDLPRVIYSTAGQSDPIPGPLDSFSLDNKVRFIGDRVAFVAAETSEIADRALKLIDVDYEVLPPVLDPGKSFMLDTACIHDEPEFVNFDESDPSHNIAAKIRIDIGNVEQGFSEADRIFEADYDVPKVQQAHIEPHVVVSYWDEDDRLVIRSSTQVPFHVRRIPCWLQSTAT